MVDQSPNISLSADAARPEEQSLRLDKPSLQTPTATVAANLDSDQFSISDESSANWIVRRIVEARAYARRVETWAAIEIQRSTSDERRFLHRFGPQLETWLRQEITAHHLRRKSIALPAGQLGLRKAPNRLDVIDPNQATTWARQNLPASVRITVSASGEEAIALRAWCESNAINAIVNESVSKTDLNHHLRSSGELPDGVLCSGGYEQLIIA
ncbi:MAG: hypothetical protein ACTHLZ_09410 [Tepidisphaeraceae bacterium]